MRVLTFDEQEKYLKASTPLLRDVATMMLESGMRPEEVYRIRPENVNLAGGSSPNVRFVGSAGHTCRGTFSEGVCRSC